MKAEREQVKVLDTPAPSTTIIPTEFTLEMIIDIFTEKIANKNTELKYCNDLKRIFYL